MKIVLDTNCFISCIGRKSKHRPVFDAFLNNKYTLCVSTEILLEYEEMFEKFWRVSVAHNLLGTVLTATNIIFSNIFYNFYLVENDADDNKFADAYLSSGADILVSNDKRLLALNKRDYPAIKVLNLDEFLLLIQQEA